MTDVKKKALNLISSSHLQKSHEILSHSLTYVLFSGGSLFYSYITGNVILSTTWLYAGILIFFFLPHMYTIFPLNFNFLGNF